MIAYDITFIHTQTNRIFSFDNVIELSFIKEHVIVKCREKNNDIFCTAVLADEFDKLVLTKEDKE